MTGAFKMSMKKAPTAMEPSKARCKNSERNSRFCLHGHNCGACRIRPGSDVVQFNVKIIVSSHAVPGNANRAACWDKTALYRRSPRTWRQRLSVNSMTGYNYFDVELYDVEGRVVVETRAPRARHVLAPGEHCVVPPKTAHRASGEDGERCRFTIVQGVGEYDYIPISTPG